MSALVIGYEPDGTPIFDASELHAHVRREFGFSECELEHFMALAEASDED